MEKDNMSQLSKDSQQVDSTTKQYLYLMISSFLNKILRDQGPSITLNFTGHQTDPLKTSWVLILMVQ